MQTKLNWLAVCVSAVLAAACAGELKSSTPVATPAANVPAVQVAGGAAAALSSAPTTVSAVNTALINQGYRVQKRNERVFYCRPELVTGTMFRSMVCLTEAQIEHQKKVTRENGDTLNQQRRVQCVGPECSSR
jgi:hypothetical protein